MKQIIFGRHSGPVIALGGLLAVACLVSTWYIHRLQADLARAVRDDVVRLEAAEELQISLRQLRFHSLMAAADPSPQRLRLLSDDRTLVADALSAARRKCDSEEDIRLLRDIERGYREYEVAIAADIPPKIPQPSGPEMLRWADAHPVRGLLVPCRELANRQRDRMTGSLERSDTQTTWAGRVLCGLALVGALGGVMAGYATARGHTRRAAQLSVRVQAVQAQLDQEVGALTVEPPLSGSDLDAQLDRIVGRVKEVCQRLQEQERDLLRAEQLAAVGHLAAGVAHEIRNPLTGMKFLIETAVRPIKPTPLSDEDLHLMREEIVRIERTVQGLLDFARTPPPVRQRLDLRDVVAEAVGVVRGRAEAKPVAVRADVPPEPVAADIDHDQMLSLLTNLLVNAIDAAPPGGAVGVQVRTGRDTVKVNVTDTGPGLDPTVVGRLFTPFATTKPTGTGLGLSIARRVAVEHGGSLTAANRPEGGAVFALTLPPGGVG
jgi:signal transduction histidine kinase